jgi:nicotinate-nucleotide--dimethylbenzimidazole phosphoribosyltransferase
MQKVAVVLDGEAALAAAAVVAGLDRSGISHCMMGDGGGSAVAVAAADRLGLEPILQLGMASGDAAAGAIAAGVVKAAALVHSGAAELAARGAA